MDDRKKEAEARLQEFMSNLKGDEKGLEFEINDTGEIILTKYTEYRDHTKDTAFTPLIADVIRMSAFDPSVFHTILVTGNVKRIESGNTQQSFHLEFNEVVKEFRFGHKHTELKSDTPRQDLEICSGVHIRIGRNEKFVLPNRCKYIREGVIFDLEEPSTGDLTEENFTSENESAILTNMNLLELSSSAFKTFNFLDFREMDAECQFIVPELEHKAGLLLITEAVLRRDENEASNSEDSSSRMVKLLLCAEEVYEVVYNNQTPE